jgi:DNA-binding MarR family transcriptional regulator
MYSWVVDAGRLHKLARVLREIASAATAEPGDAPVSPGLLAIAEDISSHAGTTAAEIASRTGLAQSMVSKTVARMREHGVVSLAADPTDKRRVLVSIDVDARAAIFTSRGQRPISGALRARIPKLTDVQIEIAERLLDDLAGLLYDSRPVGSPPNARPPR